MAGRITRAASAIAAGLIGLALGGCSQPAPTPTTSTAVAVPTSGPVVTPSSTSVTTAAVPDAARLLTDVQAATTRARNGHAQGRLTLDHEVVDFESAGTTYDSNASGTFTADDVKSEYRIVDAVTYVRANAAGWVKAGVPAGRAKEIAESQKWVQAPPEASTGTIKDVTFGSLVHESFAGIAGSSTSGTVTSEASAGVDCWLLSEELGSDRARLYTAKDTHLPVRLVIDGLADVTFDQWNATPTVAAPSAAAIIH